MGALSSLYVVPFLCNCLLVSSSLLTPIKPDGDLRLFKDAEFKFLPKRNFVDGRSDDPDSKERRSSSASFIRYGRSEGNMENTMSDGMDGDSKVNRYPRWKSPDIVIRFGRSEFKAEGAKGYKRGRNDLNFIRYGRNAEVYPLEVDMTSVCSELQNGNVNRDLPYMSRLLRLCYILDVGEHRNNLDFLDEADSKHE